MILDFGGQFFGLERCFPHGCDAENLNFSKLKDAVYFLEIRNFDAEKCHAVPRFVGVAQGWIGFNRGLGTAVLSMTQSATAWHPP